MSTDSHAALASKAPNTEAVARSKTSELIETALTVAFTAAAVLFISFLAVVTGLV